MVEQEKKSSNREPHCQKAQVWTRPAWACSGPCSGCFRRCSGLEPGWLGVWAAWPVGEPRGCIAPQQRQRCLLTDRDLGRKILIASNRVRTAPNPYPIWLGTNYTQGICLIAWITVKHDVRNDMQKIVISISRYWTLSRRRCYVMSIQLYTTLIWLRWQRPSKRRLMQSSSPDLTRTIVH